MSASIKKHEYDVICIAKVIKFGIILVRLIFQSYEKKF